LIAPSDETRQAREPRRAVDGIVLVDKPLGLSSNQALQRVKRLYRALKAGHCGSLDPLASGMLPICLGEATKVSAFLLGSDKVYRFRLALGARTTTGDAEGPVVETGPAHVGEADLARALGRFHGEIRQVPPMFSALKQGGQPLYALARAGKEVEREARAVHIYDLVVEVFDAASPLLRVRCSKGTYVRTLAEDIAHELGTVGHLSELRRLAVAPFTEPQMRTLAALEAAAGEADAALVAMLLPPDAALEHLPRVDLAAADAVRIRQGQALREGPSCAGPPGLVRLYGAGARFLGVGERLVDPDGLVPRRLLASAAKGEPGL
jgi:tRNA pseudouridine55 synthase